MKTIFVAIWIASNCGPINAPKCDGNVLARIQEGIFAGEYVPINKLCKCTTESKDLDDQIEAEKWALLRGGKVIEKKEQDFAVPRSTSGYIHAPFTLEIIQGLQQGDTVYHLR